MKVKIPPGLIRLAYKVFDVEASAETAATGSRTIEYAFALQKLARMPKGNLLDIGCTAKVNPIPATLCELGWEVWGLDLREYKFRHPNFHFVKADIDEAGFEPGFFDAVCAISTLEHLGLGGRYGVTKENKVKDVKTVNKVHSIIKKDGTFIATVPFASSSRVVKPFQRIYDKSALESLFHCWFINQCDYFALKNDGFWGKLGDLQNERIFNKDGESAVALLELKHIE
jgi:hypothetical protein